MRNLTVRVPDDVYQAARLFAARNRSSISAVVADFLFSLRNLVRFPEPVSSGQATDLHCNQLRESNIGRVNLEPFNEKEWMAIARYIMELCANGSRTEAVHTHTNPE
jgi:hypothetical protein